MTHDPTKTVILLAEDEIVIRNLVNVMLGKQGYAVLIATNGAEALEVCRRFTDPIHLLLSNIHMPQLDGVELMKAVSALRPDIKVVLMSGNLDSQILATNRPDAFLSKPFLPPTLLELIRQVLDGQRPRVSEL